MPVKRDELYHTYADYLTWSATYGDELIDGTAYVSRGDCVSEPPSPSFAHQGIVAELCAQLVAALRDRPCRACVAPLDIRLPKSVEEDDLVDTVMQPDVFIVCDPKKIDGRGVRGAPDWIAEVLSPGTANYDQLVKVPAYERAGVRELWLIHPIDRTLTVYQLAAGRYGPPIALELKGTTQLTAVPGVIVEWDPVVAHL